MPVDVGLSDAGLVVPRTSDYLDRVRDTYRSLTGLDVDWNNDEILGIFSAIMAHLLGKQGEGLQAVYDAGDENAATGVQLANIARLTGTTKRPATYSQVVLTLIGTPGTIVTKGKMAEGGGPGGRARWILTEDATIGPGGTVVVVARAEEAGRILARENRIKQIVTPIPGWTGVTNPDAASAGLEAETDDELRVRRRRSLAAGGGNGIPALRGKLLNLPFLADVAVLDNPDNEAKVVQGIGLDAHSFMVVVLPDTLTTSQKEQVLRLVYTNTPVSTRSSGTSVVGTITGADGVGHTVRFNYGGEIAANFVVHFVMAPGYSDADASAQLRRKVIAHMGTLRLGDPLLRLRIDSLAVDIPGVLEMIVLINGQLNLVPSAVQQAVFGSWTLT
jgi:baseplate J-like protein